MPTCVSFSTVTSGGLFLGMLFASFGIQTLALAGRTRLVVRLTPNIRHLTVVQEY